MSCAQGEYRHCEAADQQTDWERRPWYICTFSGDWFCMLCGNFAKIPHLASARHKRRLAQATRIPEARWIAQNRDSIRRYIHTHKPYRWSLQGLEEQRSTNEYECMSSGRTFPPGPPPSPPPLHFVTVPYESVLWQQYKRYLYKKGVVDYSGTLITTTPATLHLYSVAAQYRLQVGCKLNAFVEVPGIPEWNYIDAYVGEEFELLYLGNPPDNENWLWVKNALSEEGWISRSVVGKRGLPYYPWEQSFLGL